MADKPFLTDIKTLRERARKHIEKGAVTEGYTADRDTVIKLLNEALATELVCVLRYKRHYFMANGIHADSVKVTDTGVVGTFSSQNASIPKEDANPCFARL